MPHRGFESRQAYYRNLIGDTAMNAVKFLELSKEYERDRAKISRNYQSKLKDIVQEQDELTRQRAELELKYKAELERISAEFNEEVRKLTHSEPSNSEIIKVETANGMISVKIGGES